MVAKIRMAASAIRGRSHETAGIPCQDRATVSRGRTVSVIALSDGAGTAQFSDVGAGIVVSAISKYLRANFHTLLNLDGDQIAERIITRLQRSLWRYAENAEIHPRDLAATLLFAATDGETFLCGQLGDGRVARFSVDLSISESIFDGHKGEHFNETVFVTSDSALGDLLLEWGDVGNIGGFALMSDGTEESLFNRADKKFAPALARMLAWFDTHSERRVQDAVTNNLEKILRERTQDDMSLALMRICGKS